jgi:hypothetical protein
MWGHKTMLGLYETKYSTVFLKKAKVVPWIIDETSVDQICLNAEFVKKTICNKPTSRQGLRSRLIDWYSQPLSSSLSLDECFEYLGIVATSTALNAFISPEEYEARLGDSELSLLTEKFMFPIVDSAGAGRHVLLKTAQLKSIGRNALCINEDYFHSWGGQMIQDAIKSYVSALYIDQRCKIPSLKIHALCLYDKIVTGGVQSVLVVRDARTFRLSQLFPHTLNENEKETVRKHLENFFIEKSPIQMIESIIDNYVHAYSVGVRYEGISPDNLLIDGRWIDTESVNILPEKQSHDTWIQVGIPGNEGELSIEKFKEFASFLSKDGIFFRDSWIHRLFLMSEATYEVYKGLWGDLNFDLISFFQKTIKKYFPKLDHRAWFLVLEAKDSYYKYRFSFPCKTQHLKPQALTAFREFGLNGYYYDDLDKNHYLTFGIDPENSHEKMMRMVKKWDKVYYPFETGIDSAINLGREIRSNFHS